MNLNTNLLNDDYEKIWDEFVEKSCHGTIYHTFKWKKVIDKVPFYNQEILGIFNGPELVGGAVWVKKTNLNFKLATIPLATQYIGFVLSDSPSSKLSEKISYQHKIIISGLDYLEKNYDEINLMLSPSFSDLRPFIQLNYTVTPQLTYYLNFEDEEKLWESLDGSLRRQIKKADEKNFIINEYCSAEEFLNIMKLTFKRKGENLTIPDEIIIGTLQENCLKNNRYIFCAKDKKGGLVSCIIFLVDSKRCYYTLAGTHPDFLNTGVQSWLIWQALKALRTKQITMLDFLGANIPSIARFKEHFNPEPKTYYRMQKFPSTSLNVIKSIRKIIKKQILQ